MYCCWMESWLVIEVGWSRRRAVERKSELDATTTHVRTPRRKESHQEKPVAREGKRRLQLGNTVVEKGERVILGHGRSSGLRSVGLRGDPASEPRCARLLEVYERGVVADPVLPEDDHVVFPPED